MSPISTKELELYDKQDEDPNDGFILNTKDSEPNVVSKIYQQILILLGKQAGIISRGLYNVEYRSDTAKDQYALVFTRIQQGDNQLAVSKPNK